MSIDADARKAQVGAMFDRLAPEYDAVGPACFAYFGRRLVEQAAVGYGQRVLDVACGRGAVLFPAAERVEAAGEVIGIDLAEEMVRNTNIEARRRGLPVSARAGIRWSNRSVYLAGFAGGPGARRAGRAGAGWTLRFDHRI